VVTSPGEARARLARVSEELKAALRTLVTTPGYVDLAFIGNTSEHYPSTFGLMVDFDAFLFVERMDASVGTPLAALHDRFWQRCDAEKIDFQLRIVEGPYKPPIARLARPVFVAHLGLFTERLYLQSPQLRRWAWRKYVCEHEHARLSRLAPRPPTLQDFVAGPKGLRERRAAIEAGRVRMTEWALPDLTSTDFYVDAQQPNFIECCFAYSANTARNHARALGHPEADQLDNTAFFAWYDREVFASTDLLELMAHKARCRDAGFEMPVEQARCLALRYMRALET
jgi:hypothetical protein